jgi:hypothetical protein
MPLAENRTYWPHADPTAAEEHLADHNAIAALLNGGVQTHSHVDADLPAALASDIEVTAAVSAHVAADHVGLATDAEVAAGYSPLGHTHPGGGVTAGVIRKALPQTLTLAADTPVTDMAFAVAANATYYFQLDMVVTTSTGTSPTTAWGFTGPASPTAVSIVAEIDTSTSLEVSPPPLTAFGNFPVGAQVAATGAKFRGTVQTGANAGTVALTCRRAGTAASMVIPAGCNGFWMRVA